MSRKYFNGFYNIKWTQMIKIAIFFNYLDDNKNIYILYKDGSLKQIKK